LSQQVRINPLGVCRNALEIVSITGTVPIIRSPKGNAAEMVAKKLDKKLRENLFDARNNLFSTDTQRGQFNFHRPLLIILDRNVDMATPLHHTWTYQALAHDVLNLSLNRVVIEDSTAKGGNNKHLLTPSLINLCLHLWDGIINLIIYI